MGSSTSRDRPLLAYENGELIRLPTSSMNFREAEALARSQKTRVVEATDAFIKENDRLRDEMLKFLSLTEDAGNAARTQKERTAVMRLYKTGKAAAECLNSQSTITRIYKYPEKDIHGILEHWSLTTERPMTHDEIKDFKLVYPAFVGAFIGFVLMSARYGLKANRARIAAGSWEKVALVLAGRVTHMAPSTLRKIITDTTEAYGVKELSPEWKQLMQENCNAEHPTLPSKPEAHCVSDAAQIRSFTTFCARKPSRILKVADGFKTKQD